MHFAICLHAFLAKEMVAWKFDEIDARRLAETNHAVMDSMQKGFMTLIIIVSNNPWNCNIRWSIAWTRTLIPIIFSTR
jgi:hypothetical protein